MKLWLLRHGEAEVRARSDDLRALTDRGRREAQASARRLVGAASLQVILASPYVRARQTAELACQVLDGVTPLETVPWITPDSDPREALLHLDQRDEKALLLVTHQPFVGELGGLLINGHRGDPLPMKTGSLALLEGEAIAAGLMRLVSLHHPQVS